MAKDVLDAAYSLMKRRKFDKAISLLEGRSDIYEGSFEYYLLLGISCLYVGDRGSASTYFQKARKIKLTDTNLLLGQAALFLIRGDTGRAVQYYLEVLDSSPQDKTAVAALEFIRKKGDYTTICKWVDTGDIEQFFPPLGVNPYKVAGFVIPVIACVLGVLLVLHLFSLSSPQSGNRADLSDFALSVSDKDNMVEKDLSSGSFAYLLSPSKITESYEKALRYFQQYHDNLAQIEINRILNSNASVYVKQKASLLMEYIEEPTFDTIKDSPSYAEVQKEPALYLDCWVTWSGRISNVEQGENFYRADLLVGYETMERLEGIVPLSFSVIPIIDNEKAVTVLAKIKNKDGKIALEGRSVYQKISVQ